tara:strand:+ start:12114 stop:13007 length:894 start_codon:yes stop_codon:yes gene_type:complete
MAEQNTTSGVTAGDSGMPGSYTGTESSLSNWAGDYVTDMLGQGQALANEGYNAYTGPLTAGSSELQDQAFQGIAGIDLSLDQMGTGGYTPQAFTGENVNQYMNPYLMQSLQPQIDEARRQSEIDRISNAGRMTRAGSFGGSRQAVLDAENQFGMQRNIAGITGQGYADAYKDALGQFNVEQDRGMDAQDRINEYGFTGLNALSDAGATQRGITGEGIAADKAQFEEERDFPYKQVQYMQSLLQGLPIEAQSYNYAQPSVLSELASTSGGLSALYDKLFPNESKTAPETSLRPVLRPT